MGSYRVCVCFIRKFRVTEAEPPADVKAAFKKYAEGGAHLTAEQLRRFLVEVQGEADAAATADETDAVVLQILQKRHPIAKFTRHALTLDDFHHFLFSPDFNPPIASKVHHDMNAPLSHYFIYTGHNSYLTGNQLTSDCSDVPIIKALQRGVRVIELDIWPNSAKDNVNVLHGRTVTAPVELIRCLKSIKEHAFVASPYPVVITLEDHLTPDLQAKVAQMLTETFGDMLLIPETECLKSLPSPEQLKHRVVISTKPPKEYFEAFKEKQSIKDDDVDDDDDVWGNEPSTLTADKEDNHDSEDDDDYLRAPQTPAYKGLIAIHAGKPKGGMKEKLKVEPDKVRRLSLNEQALEKAAESHGTDVVRFTQRNILRIYPKGTRFNSSNYKPLIGWMHGAQMVAFNMQGYGRSLWLMQGMFRSNGGCGYVKKPDLLMNLDQYNQVGIAGVPADEAMKKTKTKADNWTPVWEEEFTFPLTVPELALLRIEVHEHDMPEKDDFAGQTCLPVSELRPGIRAVPLCNRRGEKYNSVRLLMRFEFV